MGHYIVTNRMILGEPDNPTIDASPDAKAQDSLRFAGYKLGGGLKGIDVWSDSPEGALDYKQRENTSFGSGRFFKSLYEDMRKSRKHTLFFVHGFSNTLEESLATIDKLDSRYVHNGPIGQIVLFSWPTNGRKWEYRDDASDAVPSGYALARLFLKLGKFLNQYLDEKDHPPCKQEIHLLAQSMGNQVLQSMITKLAYDWPAFPSILGEIILTGADVDEFALMPPEPLSQVHKLGERAHVYVHRRDRALWVSQHTKNRHRRLGRVGPKRYNPECYTVVDVTETDDEASAKESMVNHWYFVDVNEVVKDISAVLAGSLAEEIPGISGRSRHPVEEHWFTLPK